MVESGRVFFLKNLCEWWLLSVIFFFDESIFDVFFWPTIQTNSCGVMIALWLSNMSDPPNGRWPLSLPPTASPPLASTSNLQHRWNRESRSFCPAIWANDFCQVLGLAFWTVARRLTTVPRRWLQRIGTAGTPRLSGLLQTSTDHRGPPKENRSMNVLHVAKKDEPSTPLGVSPNDTKAICLAVSQKSDWAMYLNEARLCFAGRHFPPASIEVKVWMGRQYEWVGSMNAYFYLYCYSHCFFILFTFILFIVFIHSQ